MNILFFPSDLGGGFGHISRCLSIAYEAKARGHNCAFVINDIKYEKKISNDFNVFISKKNYRLYPLLQILLKKIAGSRSPATPLFTEISSLDFQVIRDGLLKENIIIDKLDQYMKIIKIFKPTLFIGDTNLLVWIISKKTNIPVAQIVRYAFHPETAGLLWWKKTPAGISTPNTPALFNPLLNKMGLRPIKRAEDLLQGDLFIVPSIHEIEPIPENEKTIYVGELSISNWKKEEIPSWFHEINSSKPIVYITIGGGAGSVGNKQFFSTIIEALSNKPIQGIISTSNKFDSINFPNLPNNIQMYNWVPGKLIISKSDLIIFHGGYGTMMESISYGKPSIVIPFHSEQEGNGRRLEQLGCGLVERLSKGEYKRIEAKWGYGTFSFLVQNRYDLTPEKLYEKIDKVLNNNKYLNNVHQIQSKIRNYHGAEKTITTLEKKFN